MRYILLIILPTIILSALSFYSPRISAQGSVTAEASSVIVVPGNTPTPDDNTGQSGLTPTPDDPVVIQSTPNPPPDNPDEEDDTFIKVQMIDCLGVGGAVVQFVKDGVVVLGDISVGIETILDVPFGGEWEAIIDGEVVGKVSGDGQPTIITSGSALCPTPIATPQFVPDTGTEPINITFVLILVAGLALYGLASRYSR